MPKERPSVYEIGVPIRIPGELVERIDAVKPPLVPREPYVRKLIEEAIEDLEEQEANRLARRQAARKRKRQRAQSAA